jgi:hypothetical protein
MEAHRLAFGCTCRATLLSVIVFATHLAALACGRVVTELGSAWLPGPGGSPFDASPGADATTDVAEAATEEAAGDVPEPASSGAEAASDTLEAASEASEAAACRGDLSNIGVADFHVSFSVTTSQNVLAALVNQRATCTLSDFWDVRLATNGALDVETDDVTQGANATGLKKVGPRINDGVPHKVMLQRTSGTLTVYVDGVAIASAVSRASFGQLAPIRIGSDVCTAAIDGTMPLMGTVSDLCVASP